MKILNLYAGIGGNRKLWYSVRDDLEITAIENVPEIAKIYQDFFPNDKVIIADAHQYLLDHYKEFDFIWSSPPCPTHSVTNNFLHAQGNVRYPDMSLWQEIVFLQHWFKGKWVVENFKSYYPPLWKPQELDRHYFWTNFSITPKQFGETILKTGRNFNICNARSSTRKNQEEDVRELETYLEIKLPQTAKKQRLLLRNCVYPKIGLHIFQEAFREYQKLL
jgi:DNA (cytosine-5)-methyltransferase 1